MNLHNPLPSEESYLPLGVVTLIDQLEVSVPEVNQHQSDRPMRVLTQLLESWL